MADWYSNYQNKVTLNGAVNNIRDKNVSAYYDTINFSFKDSLSYFEVTKNDDLQTIYHTWILDQKSYNQNTSKKKIVMKPDEDLNRGDIINWNNQKWLVTNIDEQTFPYNEGVLEFCNHTLKTILPNGKLIEYPCVLTEKSRSSLDLEVNNENIQQNNELIMYVQTNSDILSIPLSWRIIFGSFPYKIDNMDDATQVGIIKIKIHSDAERVGKDDFVKGIADNSVQENPTPTGNLIIQGNKSININKTGTYTIIYDNGGNTTGDFTWSLSDNIHAKINSFTGTSCVIQGLKAGQVKLTASDGTNNIPMVINITNYYV